METQPSSLLTALLQPPARVRTTSLTSELFEREVERTLERRGDERAIGIRSAEKGRAHVTPGIVNKLMGWIVKWMPRSLNTMMAALSMGPPAEPS